MLIVEGAAEETSVSGTLYERGEDPPRFRGAPDDGAPYVWVCDEFYEVDTGGSTQTIGGREIQIAFETPLPRGFHTRTEALEAAKDHVLTQFARIGIDAGRVELRVEKRPTELADER